MVSFLKSGINRCRELYCDFFGLDQIDLSYDNKEASKQEGVRTRLQQMTQEQFDEWKAKSEETLEVFRREYQVYLRSDAVPASIKSRLEQIRDDFLALGKPSTKFVSYLGALFFGALNGTYTRRIQQAQSSNQSYPTRKFIGPQNLGEPDLNTDMGLLNELNNRIIMVNQAKRKLAYQALGFTITCVAAAVFASYPLLLVGILESVAMGISTFDNYKSRRFVEITSNDSVYQRLALEYGVEKPDPAS